MVTKIKPYRIRDVNEPEDGNALQYNDPNTFVRGEGGGGGGSGEWGHIIGTLSDQTDLQDALDDKQDKLTAGEGISIGTINDYSAMRGPCDGGFHIPSANEWQSVIDSCDTILNDIWDIGDYLKMSFVGGRDWTDGMGWNKLAYWACTCTEYNGDVFSTDEDVMVSNAYFANGLHIRPFSDTIHIPDNTRTTIYDASSVATGAGIFHNPTLGLISISDDGENWITISDKNVGATTVWNPGDTSTQENSGGFFQWGNNYMFPFTGTITTSTTQVDVTGYGPGNYYSNNTFIKGNAEWFTSLNSNLRGGDTGVVILDNVITNTGVLSVNGQTGHVTVESGGKQSFFKTQDEYDALPASKESDGNLYIIVDNHLNPLTWQELEAMGSENAKAYLDQHPLDYAKYYEGTGDVLKEDYAYSMDVTLPSGKYVYIYSGDYTDETLDIGVAFVFETNLTAQEVNTFFLERIGQENTEAIISGEWNMNFGR